MFLCTGQNIQFGSTHPHVAAQLLVPCICMGWSGSSTKGRTPNIRYFVAKLSIVAIYALYERPPKSFLRKSSYFESVFNESQLAFEGLPTKVSLVVFRELSESFQRAFRGLSESFRRAFGELSESFRRACFRRAFRELSESFRRAFGELSESFRRAFRELS